MLPFCVTPLFEYIVGQWLISSLLSRHPYILLISLEIFFIYFILENVRHCNVDYIALTTSMSQNIKKNIEDFKYRPTEHTNKKDCQ